MITKELFGREVLDAEAKQIGKVTDLDFDKNKGVIDYLVVKAGSIKYYEVSFQDVSAIGDRILLKVAENQLKRKNVISL
jgi:sporulation protein YlmC with PRC-barrel domain